MSILDDRISCRLLRIFNIVIVMISCMIIMSCNKVVEETEMQRVIEERTPVFLDLEYVYSFEVDSVRNSAGFDVEGEFTCFNTYGSSIHTRPTLEEIKDAIMRDYRVELPIITNLYLDSNSFIAISIGRKLEALYYFEDRRSHIFPAAFEPKVIFEEVYHHRTVFVYLVNPLPPQGFICAWDVPHYFFQFNYFNNIPLEVWVFPPSIIVELEAPIQGYVNVQEADLKMYATRNSPIRARLEEGALVTIIAYVEGGEDIDGNSLWYYITRDNGRSGYIHSNYISH